MAKRWLAGLLVLLGFWGIFGDIDPAWAYEYRQRHDPDGIGKFFLGREIAHYMGHLGAGWLERSPREREERPNLLLDALNLLPTDSVVDLGAGTGYFSRRLAQRLPQGRVLAVDIQPEMLEILQDLAAEQQITNIQPILGSENDPHLPSHSVDVVLMVDAYHEFAYPQEMIQAIAQSLKPGGRAVLVEYRGENIWLPIKKLHKMTLNQLRREWESQGFHERTTLELLPDQHITIFQL
ncbi:MAG: class I SAM-dependent methyltransferase [Oscillatoriales cyanobacterium SM2_2_1]|nr:class I SAM-dependent methyltransferase [Oscillatoriales cyanobacterium SM2_2_1]